MEHYRDEVFVCKSDSGLWLALLPAFVKEDTQPIAEIPIQKIETKKRQFKHMLVLKQLRYSIMHGHHPLIQNKKNQEMQIMHNIENPCQILDFLLFVLSPITSVFPN